MIGANIWGRALKNTMALSVAELISKALNFAFIAVLARQLTPADFGGYTTMMTWVGFMGPLADLGLSHILVREIALNRSQAARLLFNALIVTSGLAGLAWLLLALIAAFSNYPNALRPLITLMGIAIVGNVVMQTAGSALRGFERMEVQAIVSSSLLLASSVIGISLALNGWGLTTQAVVNVFTALIGAAIMLTVVHRRFVRLAWAFDGAMCRTLLGQAWPVAALIAFDVMLRWIDVLILGQIRGMNEVAVYGAAIKIYDLAMVFVASAAMALFPALSIRWRESVNATWALYAQSLRVFAAFGLGVAVGITVLAEAIIATLFGGGYQAAVWPLRLLSWAFFFQVAAGPMGMLLITAGHRSNKWVPVIGGIALSNIVFNLLLVPRLGYMGAAVAFVMTSMLTVSIRQWIAADYFGEHLNVTLVLGRPALASVTMAGGLLALHSLNLLVLIPVGGVLFIGTLWLLGEFKQEPYRAWSALLLGRASRVP